MGIPLTLMTPSDFSLWWCLCASSKLGTSKLQIPCLQCLVGSKTRGATWCRGHMFHVFHERCLGAGVFIACHRIYLQILMQMSVLHHT